MWPGTASLAWCLSLEENDLPDSLTLVDKSKEMLKVAECIFSSFFPTIKVSYLNTESFRRLERSQLPENKFMFFANSFNEMGK